MRAGLSAFSGHRSLWCPVRLLPTGSQPAGQAACGQLPRTRIDDDGRPPNLTVCHPFLSRSNATHAHQTAHVPASLTMLYKLFKNAARGLEDVPVAGGNEESADADASPTAAAAMAGLDASSWWYGDGEEEGML